MSIQHTTNLDKKSRINQVYYANNPLTIAFWLSVAACDDKVI